MTAVTFSLLLARIERNAERDAQTGCLLWTGPLRGRTKNYPRMNIWVAGEGRKQIAVHRAALVVREIETTGDWTLFWDLYQTYLVAGFEADHNTCNQPRCVCSDHLVWRDKAEHRQVTVERARARRQQKP